MKLILSSEIKIQALILYLKWTAMKLNDQSSYYVFTCAPLQCKWLKQIVSYVATNFRYMHTDRNLLINTEEDQLLGHGQRPKIWRVFSRKRSHVSKGEEREGSVMESQLEGNHDIRCGGRERGQCVRCLLFWAEFLWVSEEQELWFFLGFYCSFLVILCCVFWCIGPKYC